MEIKNVKKKNCDVTSSFHDGMFRKCSMLRKDFKGGLFRKMAESSYTLKGNRRFLLQYLELTPICVQKIFKNYLIQEAARSSFGIDYFHALDNISVFSFTPHILKRFVNFAVGREQHIDIKSEKKEKF